MLIKKIQDMKHYLYEVLKYGLREDMDLIHKL